MASIQLAKEIRDNIDPPYPVPKPKQVSRLSKLSKNILVSSTIVGLLVASILSGKKIHNKFLELKFINLPSKIQKDIKYFAKLNLDPKLVAKFGEQKYSKKIINKAHNILTNRDSVIFYSIPGINSFLSKKFKKFSSTTKKTLK